MKQEHYVSPNLCVSKSLCFLSNFRHVKGRVLVALADGTLAIFHRSEGIWHFKYFKQSSISYLVISLREAAFILVS